MDSYIVIKPVVVNGVHRLPGAVLEGDDAQAVAASPLIVARCVKQSSVSPKPVAVKE